MRVNEACRENDLTCPFYTGVCRNKFGQFKCKSFVRNQNTEVLMYAADCCPVWDTYRVLIFTHAQGPNGRDIRRTVETRYRGVHLEYLDYQNLLCGILNQQIIDRVVDNLKEDKYVGIYIDTQDKKERRKIRQYFKDKYDLDVHIKIYAKLVVVVERMSFRK